MISLTQHYYRQHTWPPWKEQTLISIAYNSCFQTILFNLYTQSFPIFPLRLSKAEVWEPLLVTLAFLLRLNVLAFFPLTASLLICHDYCWIFQLSFPNVNQWLSTSPLSYLHCQQPFPSKWGFLPFHPLKKACLLEKSILC